MDRVNFEMCGLLTLPHETESFKSYEEKPTKKGDGKMYNLNFNVQMLGTDNKPNGNQQMMRLRTYLADKEEDRFVYVFLNDGFNSKTKKNDRHTECVAWKDRNDQSLKDKAFEYSKYVIDLEKQSIRFAARNVQKALSDGREPYEKDLKVLGLSNESTTEEINKVVEKSFKKRFEFLSEYDFVQFIHKLLTDEKYVNAFKDKKFYIKGERKYSYSASKNSSWWNDFVPQKIYLQDDDAESFARENVVFYYGADSLNDPEDSLAQIGKYVVNGWVYIREEYSGKAMFAPYAATILKTRTGNDEKDERADNVRIRRFTVDDENQIKCMGFTVNLWSGAERKEITEDDLTEDQLDSILIGDCTLEDIQREVGGVWGDRINESRFVKLMRGYSSGVQDTAFTREQIDNPVLEDENPFNDKEEDSVKEVEKTKTKDTVDDEDLFADLLDD